MKKDLFFYVLLGLLALVDAWLLSHPNLIGKMGILFFKYDMLKTFPRALATVLATVGVCWGVAYAVAAQMPLNRAKLVLILLTLASVGLLFNTYLKFSTGSYALTGAGFRAGAVLLPVLMGVTFGKRWYDLNR